MTYTITDREENASELSCRVNGVLLRCPIEGKWTRGDYLERIKNSAKLVILLNDPVYKMGNLSKEEHEKVDALEIPEFDLLWKD